MGEFKDTRWSWADKEGTKVSYYVSVNGRVTLQEIIDYVSERAPQIPLTEFQMNWATIRWEDDPSKEQIEDRERRNADSDARREVWEKEMYEKLKEKYGS